MSSPKAPDAPVLAICFGAFLAQEEQEGLDQLVQEEATPGRASGHQTTHSGIRIQSHVIWKMFEVSRYMIPQQHQESGSAVFVIIEAPTNEHLLESSWRGFQEFIKGQPMAARIPEQTALLEAPFANKLSSPNLVTEPPGRNPFRPESAGTQHQPNMDSKSFQRTRPQQKHAASKVE